MGAAPTRREPILPAILANRQPIPRAPLDVEEDRGSPASRPRGLRSFAHDPMSAEALCALAAGIPGLLATLVQTRGARGFGRVIRYPLALVGAARAQPVGKTCDADQTGATQASGKHGLAAQAEPAGHKPVQGESRND